jgi:hypothetical protein
MMASAFAGCGGTYILGPDGLVILLPAFPNDCSALAQLKMDGVTNIPIGGTTAEDAVTFQASNPAESTVQLHVQVALAGDDNFRGTVHDAMTRRGPAGTVNVSIRLNPNPYHWRCRTIDRYGHVSQWVSFGANPESSADFSVVP